MEIGQETPYIGNERLLAALRRVYALALDGDWKCDRRIRKVCADTLGEAACAAIRNDWKERKRSAAKAG